MDNRTLSLCFTNYNRFEYLFEGFEQIHDDERVREIVIVDDNSEPDIFEQVRTKSEQYSKITLYRNSTNIDCYRNKELAVLMATGDYCCIMDSDNIFGVDYLDAIFSEQWDESTILQPVFAAPAFNFENYSGMTITKHNVAEYIDKPLFSTMLNASNYFVPSKNFLSTFDVSVNPHTAEALFTNYNWLKAGNRIKVVSGLTYQHRIHSGSHYQNNQHLTGNFYNEIENKLRNLS